MPRIYVQCKFREGDRKSYMYHVDEDFGLRVGDVVKVPGKHPGDGWQRATLVEILGEIAPPKFTTKPILGKVPRAELEAEVAKRFPAKKDAALKDYVEDTRSGLAGPNMFPDLFDS